MGGSHEAIDMDFRADLRVIIEAELDALGYEPDPQLPLHKLTNLYFDALTRRISPRPRQVIRARDFSCPPAHAAGLAQLVTDIETGADLAPRLSRSLDEFEFIDGMLVEWGIYHFHLGTTPHPKRPGLIQSTGDLVYAIVSADTVYFLAVLPHRQWSNERLLQVIEENWPSLLEPYALPAGTSLEAPSPSAADREMLRKAGVNAFTALPGGALIFPPGLGRTLGGKTSVRGSMRANRLLNFVDHAARQIAGGGIGQVDVAQVRLTKIDDLDRPTQITLDVAGSELAVRVSYEPPDAQRPGS
jgi:hypothetical protein